MDTTQFLQKVVGNDGLICVAGITNEGKIQQYFHETVDQAADAIGRLNNDVNVFVGLSTFQTPNSRKAENSKSIKSLFVDIDCGKDKPYVSKTEGLEALQDFVKTTGLPAPIVVDSGSGLHAYWRLTSPVAPSVWEPVAKALKKLCREHGFQVDPAVTADAARVLRVPGTMNLKKDKARPCRVARDKTKPLSIEQFAEIIGCPAPVSTDGGLFGDGSKALQLNGNHSSAMDNLISNVQSSFKRIMKRSVKGKGCAQLLHVVKHPNDTEEPLWRAALSIAKFTKEGRKAAHRLSEGYDDYDEEETDRKFDAIEGPYTCEVFEELAPERCKKCPLKGKIKSPIVIGNEVKPQHEKITFVDGDETVELNVMREELPTLPKGYSFGPNGGILKHDLEGNDPKLIYENDIYALRLVSDPTLGETLIVRVVLPKDGIRQFLIPTSSVGAVERFRDEMAKHGVLTRDYNGIKNMTIDWINDLQKKSKSDVASRRFGWTDETMTEFVLGETVINPSGTPAPNYPTAPTSKYFDVLRPKGTLEGWKESISFYNPQGMELYQYVLCRSFGSVLMPLVPGIHASGLHMHSSGSGYGKTASLKAMMSVWGDPEELVPKAGDTLNFLYMRAEVLGNLPLAVDEFSNKGGKYCSDFVMAMTDGKQPGRMARSANEERHREKPWNLLWQSTSNFSMHEAISKEKRDNQADQARVLDVQTDLIGTVTKVGSEDFLFGLQENYGHAGPIFVQYIVKNRDKVEALYRSTTQRLSQHAKLAGAERFWSADISVTYTAFLIAKRLGLVDFEESKLFAFAMSQLQKNIQWTKETKVDVMELLNNYVMQNYGSVLVVESAQFPEKAVFGMGHPAIDPRVKLIGRYDTEKDEMWVHKTEFQQWVVEQRISYKAVETALVDKFGAKVTRDSLTKGARLKTSPVPVIKLENFGMPSSDEEPSAD